MIHITHPANDSDCTLSMHLDNEQDTLDLGVAVAEILTPGLKVWLLGNLGSGKTTLTRGVLRALGHEGKVKSPTYTLIEPYVVSRLDLYHFDFYRLNSPEEYLDAGLDEYFSGQGVCIVEWPQHATPYLAAPDLSIFLEPDGSGRRADIRGTTDKGRTCVSQLPVSLKPPPAARPD